MHFLECSLILDTFYQPLTRLSPYDLVQINYEESFPSIIDRFTGYPNGVKAKEILSNKLNIWKYEQEARVLTTEKFVNIEITDIIFGLRTDPKDKKLIERANRGQTPIYTARF